MKLMIEYKESRINGEEMPVVKIEIPGDGRTRYFDDKYNMYSSEDEKEFYLKPEYCKVEDIDDMIKPRNDVTKKRDCIAIVIDTYSEGILDVPEFIECLKEKLAIQYNNYKDKNKLVNEMVKKCNSTKNGNWGTSERYKLDEKTNLFEFEN